VIDKSELTLFCFLDKESDGMFKTMSAVSYTHLTLPTSDLV